MDHMFRTTEEAKGEGKDPVSWLLIFYWRFDKSYSDHCLSSFNSNHTVITIFDKLGCICLFGCVLL